MTVNGVKADDNTESQANVSSPQMKGLYTGVQNAAAPPGDAVRFRTLLKSAGFNSNFSNWQGVVGDNYVFVVSYK